MSLRDTLARKRQRETSYDLLIEDPSEAEEQYEQAEKALRRATVTHGEDSPEADTARAALADARAALAACVHRITFRNLPPDEFEALVAAHEPTKEQQAKGDEWNVQTFRPALLAACAVDADLTEKEWADELASERWTTADRDLIFRQALAANVTARSVVLPKG